jgi:hypothetical protein
MAIEMKASTWLVIRFQFHMGTARFRRTRSGSHLPRRSESSSAGPSSFTSWSPLATSRPGKRASVWPLLLMAARTMSSLQARSYGRFNRSLGTRNRSGRGREEDVRMCPDIRRRCVVRDLSPARSDHRTLLKLAQRREKLAIDAPFGWPNFVDALNAHGASEAWPAPDDEEPEIFRASLSFRATDRVVMHTRRPLSVSTDKLGVTAMRGAAASMVGDRNRRSTGRGKFVEVYSAGALAR